MAYRMMKELERNAKPIGKEMYIKAFAEILK